LILLEIHRAVTKRGKFTGLEWILLEIHRAGMDFTGDSPGWNEIYWRIAGLLRNEESSPGWNGFYWRFTGLEWILLEIHRAGMTFTGNALADMNLLEESPGCYGFSWRFTGLEQTQVKVHRAVMDLIKVHRAVMDLIVESPGCYGLTPKTYDEII
jgi:hypothetical protein